MIDFKGAQYPKEVIIYAVFFYVRYAVSYRDLEEIMAERGVSVDHSSLNRWVVRYAPQVASEAKKRKRPVAGSWRLDETYRVPGVQGKHGCLNEPRVYLKYINIKAGTHVFVTKPGCAGLGV